MYALACYPSHVVRVELSADNAVEADHDVASQDYRAVVILGYAAMAALAVDEDGGDFFAG